MTYGKTNHKLLYGRYSNERRNNQHKSKIHTIAGNTPTRDSVCFGLSPVIPGNCNHHSGNGWRKLALPLGTVMRAVFKQMAHSTAGDYDSQMGKQRHRQGHLLRYQQVVFIVVLSKQTAPLPVGVKIMMGNPQYLPGHLLRYQQVVFTHVVCKRMAHIACWGSDSDGQSTPPTGTFTQVSAGYYHTCGLQTDGTIACWGMDTNGQSTPPANVFSYLSAGGLHTCGILPDGTLSCWGLDNYGQSTAPSRNL